MMESEDEDAFTSCVSADDRLSGVGIYPPGQETDAEKEELNASFKLGRYFTLVFCWQMRLNLIECDTRCE